MSLPERPAPINEPIYQQDIKRQMSPIWSLWLQYAAKRVAGYFTGLFADYFQFNTTATGIPTTEGTISWNAQDHTLNIQSEITGSMLQVGQENWVRVVNKTGSTISDGKAVYISGAQGNRPKASLAKADAENTSYTIGVATADIENNAEGYVTIFGLVRGFNTSGFTAGDSLYLSASTAGALTNVRPAAPDHGVFVATALNSTNNGMILVNPDTGMELSECHDVKITSLADKQLLVYDNSNKYWKNTTNITLDDSTRTLTTNTNDLVVNCGTEKTIRLEEPVWKDIDFPIVIRTTGTNIPVYGTVLGNLTMPVWQVNDFNVCEIQEIVHEWEEGSSIYWHIHMLTAVQDATDRYVNWEVEFNYANIYVPSAGGAYSSDMSWQGTNTVVTSGNMLIPANTPIRTNIIIPINTWAYTAGKIGAHVKTRLRRIAVTGGVAQPSVDPFCEMLQMHVLCDTLGSRKIGAK